MAAVSDLEMNEQRWWLLGVMMGSVNEGFYFLLDGIQYFDFPFPNSGFWLCWPSWLLKHRICKTIRPPSCLAKMLRATMFWRWSLSIYLPFTFENFVDFSQVLKPYTTANGGPLHVEVSLSDNLSSRKRLILTWSLFVSFKCRELPTKKEEATSSWLILRPRLALIRPFTFAFQSIPLLRSTPPLWPSLGVIWMSFLQVFIWLVPPIFSSYAFLLRSDPSGWQHNPFELKIEGNRWDLLGLSLKFYFNKATNFTEEERLTAWDTWRFLLICFVLSQNASLSSMYYLFWSHFLATL